MTTSVYSCHCFVICHDISHDGQIIVDRVVESPYITQVRSAAPCDKHVLKGLDVGPTAKVVFAPNTAFFKDLKSRTDQYFTSNGISEFANRAMIQKTIFWLATAWGLWAALVFAPLGTISYLAVWALFGFALACVGFNVGHDAIHGAYSRNPRVNAWLSVTFDMMGASSAMWRGAHNFTHHTYTSVADVDADIEPGITLAFYHRKDVRFWHRFQHIYAWPLYSLVGVLWMYHKDFFLMLKRDPATHKKPQISTIFGVLAGKFAHLFFFVFVPVMTAKSLTTALLGYLIAMLVAGLTLAVVFQLAHVVDSVVAVQLAPGVHRMDAGFFEHQLRTTANFGTSPLSTFITGGLTHQIEHHLFPRICHIHYPALSPIVAACAAEHGLAYHHSGTFLEALRNHTRTLKDIGNAAHPERVVTVDVTVAAAA